MELRRLKAEFDAAFGAMGGDTNRSDAGYQEAAARYRAWIAALDTVALALLDDIDAFEGIGGAPRRHAGQAPGSLLAVADPDPTEFDRFFSGITDLQRTVDLIGSAATPDHPPRKSTPMTRAMNIVGTDRAARLWSVGPSGDGVVHHHR